MGNQFDTNLGYDDNQKGFIPFLRQMRNNGIFEPTYIKYEDNMIYTLFFPSQSDKDAPLLVFYPGGPGGSGLYAMFSEYGPYRYNPSTDTWERNEIMDLTSKYNLLYMDISEDTGYSYMVDNSDENTDTNNKEIDIDKNKHNTLNDKYLSEMMTVAIEEIYDDKISVKNTPIYVNNHNTKNTPISLFGFSYAGKLLPMVARNLIEDGYDVDAVGIFSGYTDPLKQEIRPIAEYLLYIGGISNSEYQEMEKLSIQVESLINNAQAIDSTNTHIGNKYWKEAQTLYSELISNIWARSALDTYNIDDDILESMGIGNDNTGFDINKIFNDPTVMEILGAKSDYKDVASFDIDTDYSGFLMPATSDLKWIIDHGVFVLYFMGSFDGATFIKGTKDMFTDLYGNVDEQIWSKYELPNLQNISDIDKETIEPDNEIYGKISIVNPNLAYGVIYSEGHSFAGQRGQSAFPVLFDYLYNQRVTNPVESNV